MMPAGGRRLPIRRRRAPAAWSARLRHHGLPLRSASRQRGVGRAVLEQWRARLVARQAHAVAWVAAAEMLGEVAGTCAVLETS